MHQDPILMCLKVYDEMRRVAAEGRTITCTELGERVGLSQDSAECRAGLCRLVDTINLYLHQQGQPMLSAVMVTKENGRPPWGFFDQAHSLGRYNGQDHHGFFQEELRKVFSCFSSAERA
jgi:hypothetical protein